MKAGPILDTHGTDVVGTTHLRGGPPGLEVRCALPCCCSAPLEHLLQPLQRAQQLPEPLHFQLKPVLVLSYCQVKHGGGRILRICMWSVVVMKDSVLGTKFQLQVSTVGESCHHA